MIRRTALAALGIVALLGGCAKALSSDDEAPGPRRDPCVCEPALPIVDPTLLAFLSKARAEHHEADLAEDEGDRARAVATLERLVLGARPGGPQPAPEVAEVIADTRARLADLRSALGEFDAASRDVDDGLRLATEPTHFRGRLFEVRGLVEERREKVFKAAGDAAGAAEAHQAAIKAFEQAIAIQDAVIARALSDGGSTPPSR